MTSFRRIILPIITALCFAGSFPAAKYASLDFQPLTMAFIRYLITLIFLASLLFYYKRSTLRVEKGDIYKFFLMGLLGIVGYHYFFFISIRHTAVANTAVINAFNPVITAGLAAMIIRERLRKLNYIGLLIAVAGVLILVTRARWENLARFDFNIGDFYMLCAVFCWAFYSLIIKGMSRKYGNYTLTFYASLFGVIQLGTLVFLENPAALIQHVSTASIISLIYMGIVASGIGYSLYNLSIKENGPTRTAAVVYSLVPIFVGTLSFLLLAEAISVVLIFSTILIITGLNFVLKK
jgi:drug/metabolite transporter (DMT)-like permease